MDDLELPLAVGSNSVGVKVFFTWVSADFPESAYSSRSLGSKNFTPDHHKIKYKLFWQLDYL